MGRFEGFIGRENELNKIDRFCRDDKSKLLLVDGDNGIGKTALLNEFASRLTGSYLVFKFNPERGESIINYIFQWFKDLQKGKVFFRGQDAWAKIMQNEEKIADFINLALSFERVSMSFRLAELLDRISSVLDDDGKLLLIIDPEDDLSHRDSAELLKCFFSRKLEKAKIVLLQRVRPVVDTEDKSFDNGKINTLALEGFSEKETKMKLLGAGLADEIGADLLQRFLRISEGNPLYIEYSIKFLQYATKQGKTIESAIDSLPKGLDNLMLELYNNIDKDEQADIVHWASIVSGDMGLDMMSFLTSLSKDRVSEIINDEKLDMIIKKAENSEGAFNGSPDFMVSNNEIDNSKVNNSILIKPLHQKLSGVIIKKLSENDDDLCRKYKRLAAYFLKCQIDNKDNFEALRLYHLYLYLSKDKEAYTKAANGLIEKFYAFRHKDSCIDMLERVIEYSKDLGNSKGDYVKFISKAGIICHEQRHIDKAIDFFNQSISIYNEIKNKEGEASDLGNLGVVYRDSFRVDEAKKYLEKSLEIYSSIDCKIGQANILTQLWKIDYEISNFDKAIELLLKLMIVTKELGFDEKMPTILGNIGNLYCGSGDYDKAVIYYEQALDSARRFGDANKVASYYGRIGISYLYNNLHLEAVEYFSNSLRIYKKIGDIQGQATQCGNIGIVYKKMGRLNDSIEYFESALKLFTKKGSTDHIKLMKRNIETVKKMQEENENKKD